MSIRPLNQYLMRLASTGTMYHNVVSSLSLVSDKQRGGGLIYSKIAFRKLRILTEEEIEAVRTLSQHFKALARPIQSGEPLNAE